jgi:hypothetical protein
MYRSYLPDVYSLLERPLANSLLDGRYGPVLPAKKRSSKGMQSKPTRNSSGMRNAGPHIDDAVESRAYRWTRQFPSGYHISGSCAMLEKVKLINRRVSHLPSHATPQLQPENKEGSVHEPCLIHPSW